MTLQSIGFIRIAIFALAIMGFFVARHIYKHKKGTEKPLVCPMKFDCTAVVHSDYSKFLGIPLEVLGMFYYGVVSIFYFYLIFIEHEPSILLISLAVALSVSALLMSLYLIFVQTFILRKGCLWCIISAFISILICIATVYAYDVIGILTGQLI